MATAKDKTILKPVNLKKVIKKSNKKLVPKRKDPSQSKAAIAKREKIKKEKPLSANNLCRSLLLEKKYSDAEILLKVQQALPDTKFKRAYISIKRWDMFKDGTSKVKLDKIPDKK